MIARNLQTSHVSPFCWFYCVAEGVAGFDLWSLNDFVDLVVDYVMPVFLQNPYSSWKYRTCYMESSTTVKDPAISLSMELFEPLHWPWIEIQLNSHVSSILLRFEFVVLNLGYYQVVLKQSNDNLLPTNDSFKSSLRIEFKLTMYKAYFFSNQWPTDLQVSHIETEIKCQGPTF